MGSDRVSRQIDLRNAFKQWDLKKCGGLDEEEFQALRELRMHSRRDSVCSSLRGRSCKPGLRCHSRSHSCRVQGAASLLQAERSENACGGLRSERGRPSVLLGVHEGPPQLASGGAQGPVPSAWYVGLARLALSEAAAEATATEEERRELRSQARVRHGGRGAHEAPRPRAQR